MIDTSNELRCKNPACGNLVTQIRGHRRREYCNDTCKQTAYRLRKEDHHDVTIVDDSTQQRIAELEQALEQVQERLLQYVQQTNEKLGQQAGELARYRQIVDLSDRQQMIAQFMLIGEEMGYKPLLSVDVRPGPHAWYSFTQSADDELLARGVAAARNYYKILADLQTTKEVEQLHKIITDLRLERNRLKQELEDCNRKQS